MIEVHPRDMKVNGHYLFYEWDNIHGDYKFATLITLTDKYDYGIIGVVERWTCWYDDGDFGVLVNRPPRKLRVDNIEEIKRLVFELTEYEYLTQIVLEAI